MAKLVFGEGGRSQVSLPVRIQWRIRGLGLAGLCEFGTVGQQRWPRWIFREPVESLDTTQLPPDRNCTFLPRQEEEREEEKDCRLRTQPPLRPTTEEEEEGEGEGKGLLRWGVAPLWVKEEEEKGRAPHRFANRVV